jgi:hypothetical protein
LSFLISRKTAAVSDVNAFQFQDFFKEKSQRDKHRKTSVGKLVGETRVAAASTRLSTPGGPRDDGFDKAARVRKKDGCNCARASDTSWIVMRQNTGRGGAVEFT